MDDDLPTKPTMSLCDRLHALPQELFDEIYDFTFTVSAGKKIRTDWRVFPSVLQVNRAHRRELGEVYYGSNIFVVFDAKEAVKWYRLVYVGDYGFTAYKNIRIMTPRQRSDEEAQLVNWPTPRESQLGRNLPYTQRSLVVGMGTARVTNQSWRRDLETQSATQFPALPKADRKRTPKSTGVTSLAIRFDRLGCS